MPKTTLGVIVGNRGFFPDTVARDGQTEILSVLAKEGFDTVCLTPEQTKFGTVESFSDAKACADLFQRNASKIDGILVTLPNFGDERGVANAIRLSGLTVPVLVHAYPDELKKFAIGQRRDSFCGKFSVCSNLTQYNIPFTRSGLNLPFSRRTSGASAPHAASFVDFAKPASAQSVPGPHPLIPFAIVKSCSSTPGSRSM
jgi:L-fucose isomerase-like protein